MATIPGFIIRYQRQVTINYPNPPGDGTSTYVVDVDEEIVYEDKDDMQDALGALALLYPTNILQIYSVTTVDLSVKIIT